MRRATHAITEGNSFPPLFAIPLDSFPIVCHHFSGIPHCRSVPIVYNSQLSFISHYLSISVYIILHCQQSLWSVISQCMSLSFNWYSQLFVYSPIVYNSQLSFIPHYLPFPLYVIIYCLPFPCSVISHCLSLSFTWYSPLFVFYDCL